MFLFLNRCVYGASVSAGTAADALVSVNNVLAVALGNATYRTSIGACATADALIGNFVCHLNNLHFCCHIYSITSVKKIKYISQNL